MRLTYCCLPALFVWSSSAMAAASLPARSADRIVPHDASWTIVHSIAELAKAITRHPDGRYRLAADYDASHDGTYIHAPILTTLTGRFDGAHHTISHLSIAGRRRQVYVGLFAHIGQGATVRDLNLAAVSFDYTRASFVGALAAANDGKVVDVTATGTIKVGGSRAGGLVGMEKGQIIRGTTSVTITGGVYATLGGIAGLASGGSVKGSRASGDLSASKYCQVGGLVGIATGTTILNSSASGSVSAVEGNGEVEAGGLVGVNSGAISHSFATGSVAAPGSSQSQLTANNAGGLVGLNQGSIDEAYATGAVSGNNTYAGALVGSNEGTIQDAYALGSAFSGQQVRGAGGLVGHQSGSIANVYATGAVAATDGDLAGGLIGIDDSQLSTDAYWNLDTSGISNPSQGAGNVSNDPGITGLTDAELKSGLPAGFDPAVWGQNAAINNGWPYLLTRPPS